MISNGLTDIEKKILLLVIDGKTTIEIAEDVGYSPSNIKKIIRKLFKYYKVSKRLDLVRESMKCFDCCHFRQTKK